MFFVSHKQKEIKVGILTKNFVTFKRWDGVKDEKNQYYAGSLKKRFIGVEAVGHKKLIYRMKLPKKCGRGAWTVFRFKGTWKKERWRGGEGVLPKCTL